MKEKYNPALGSTLPLAIMIVSYPLGTALQNMGMLLALILSLYTLKKTARPPHLPPVGAMRWSALSLLGFLLWTVVATGLNPLNIGQDSIQNLIGFLPLVLLPCLMAVLPAPSDKQIHFLEKLAALTTLTWGLLATSQVLWPWRIDGSSIAWGGIPRAQGFYSHPLTLAYAALLIWPYSLRKLFTQPKLWLGWALVLGCGLLLISSMSRTAQALAAIFAIFNAVRLFSGQQRWLALGLLIVLGIGLGVTDNPVSKRFNNLLHGTSNDHFSNYPDDRLAFWDAHRLIIKERPLVGHGIHLDYAFRHPYYEKLGLGDFRKQYEAHNQYIQITAEGGLIALVLFAAWLVFSLRALSEGHLPPFLSKTARQVLWIFILGGLTQNAFFDSEVRMGLIILWVVVAIAWSKKMELANEG